MPPAGWPSPRSPPSETAPRRRGYTNRPTLLQNLLHMNDVQLDHSKTRTMDSEAAAGSSIRIAEDADREAIRGLVNLAFEIERFLKKGGGDRLQNDGEYEALWERGTFLVKEENGALTGCVYIEPRGDRAYLGLLSIDPARQGGGLGKQLNAAAEAFARRQGCRWMDLRVVSPRAEVLLPIYRRLGYAETGTQEYPPVLVEKMTIPGHFILMAKAL